MRLSLFLFLTAVPGTNAIIDDILNFVLGPLIGLLAKPACDKLLDSVETFPFGTAEFTCSCKGRFRGLGIIGLVSCSTDETLCGFSPQVCGDDASVDATVVPSLFGDWKFEVEGIAKNLVYNGVPAASIDDEYRTFEIELSLIGFSFLIEEYHFMIGEESCKTVVCDEEVPLAQANFRVLVDCRDIDISGDQNLDIEGPAFLPNCPLDLE